MGFKQITKDHVVYTSQKYNIEFLIDCYVKHIGSVLFDTRETDVYMVAKYNRDTNWWFITLYSDMEPCYGSRVSLNDKSILASFLSFKDSLNDKANSLLGEIVSYPSKFNKFNEFYRPVRNNILSKIDLIKLGINEVINLIINLDNTDIKI